MSKPRPGVCGPCGAPVLREAVRPEDLRQWGRAWVSGHLYHEEGTGARLVRVRCIEHAEPGDPRLSPVEVHGF